MVGCIGVGWAGEFGGAHRSGSMSYFARGAASMVKSSECACEVVLVVHRR